MPYIPQEDRDRLEPSLQALFDVMLPVRGEYVYLVYRIAKHWLDKSTRRDYVVRSNASSILTDADQEFRRQYLCPYEDEKRRENGEV